MTGNHITSNITLLKAPFIFSMHTFSLTTALKLNQYNIICICGCTVLIGNEDAHNINYILHIEFGVQYTFLLSTNHVRACNCN